jgi:ERCC4-related helicase
VSLAYFTDPMGDEFRKAIEEALEQLEEAGVEESSEDPVKSKKTQRKKKSQMNHMSAKTKRALK